MAACIFKYDHMFLLWLDFTNIKQVSSPDAIFYLSQMEQAHASKLFHKGWTQGCLPTSLASLCSLRSSSRLGPSNPNKPAVPYIPAPSPNLLQRHHCCNAAWLWEAARVQLAAQGTLRNWPGTGIRGILKWNKGISLFKLDSPLITYRYVSAPFS